MTAEARATSARGRQSRRLSAWRQEEWAACVGRFRWPEQQGRSSHPDDTSRRVSGCHPALGLDEHQMPTGPSPHDPCLAGLAAQQEERAPATARAGGGSGARGGLSARDARPSSGGRGHRAPRRWRVPPPSAPPCCGDAREARRGDGTPKERDVAPRPRSRARRQDLGQQWRSSSRSLLRMAAMTDGWDVVLLRRKSRTFNNRYAISAGARHVSRGRRRETSGRPTPGRAGWTG